MQEPIYVKECLLDLTPSESEGVSPMENQNTDLQQELSQALAQLQQCQEEKTSILDKIQRSQKKNKIMLHLTVFVALLYSMIRFHQEMGQVGWNWLETVSGFFSLNAELLCGMALFLSVMYLLVKLFFGILDAAADDFMEEATDDDLDDR